MGISIKNARVEALARSVAHLSHEGVTEAIGLALEERLARLKGKRQPQSVAEEIMAISRRTAALPVVDRRSPESILGYNRHGAPR